MHRGRRLREAGFDCRRRWNHARATDYGDPGSSTYYDSMGAVMGRPGTGERLASSRSISQFLADAPAAPVSGGLVRPGWYAGNDCNARVFDGPGSDWDNPFSQQGRLDDNWV